MKSNIGLFIYPLIAVWLFVGVIGAKAQCSGVSLASYSSVQPVFNTYAQQMSGATAVEGVSLQYNTGSANCKDWIVKVRTTGSFVNGGV